MFFKKQSIIADKLLALIKPKHLHTLYAFLAKERQNLCYFCDMIKAEPSKLYQSFFDAYIGLKIKLHFKKHLISINDSIEEQKSVLLIANHFSWWDGFLLSIISRKHLNKKFHVMMLETQLNQFSFLKKLGAFSVNPGSRSVLTSMQYANNLLQDPKNAVLVFPQGSFKPIANKEQFVFKSGVEKLFKLAFSKTQLVMVHTQIEYGAFAKPTVFQTAKVAAFTTAPDLETIAKTFKDFATNQERIQVNLSSLMTA